MVKIEASRVEAENIKSINFTDILCSKANPGQFAMLWVPCVDEVPMSLAQIGPGDLCGVMVERVGDTTKALHDLEEGELLGIRGPFGNSFSVVKGNALLVAGGMGMAPLLPLGRALRRAGARVEMVCGARTRAEFCDLSQAEELAEKENLSITTDDGSLGTKGFVTAVLPDLLKNRKYDMVYCCGPEPMMKAVFSITEEHKVLLQASMERIIKCSVGLCGSCMIGKYRVCKDGLVLTSEQLREVADEFGVYKRGFDGSRIQF